MSDIEKIINNVENLSPRQELVNFLESSFDYFIKEKGIKIYIKGDSISPPFDLEGKYPSVEFDDETTIQLFNEEKVRDEKNFFDFVISRSSYTTNNKGDWLDIVSSKFHVQLLKEKSYFDLDIAYLKEKLNLFIKDKIPSLDLNTFNFTEDWQLREKVETLLIFILIDQARINYLPGEKNINVEIQ